MFGVSFLYPPSVQIVFIQGYVGKGENFIGQVIWLSILLLSLLLLFFFFYRYSAWRPNQKSPLLSSSSLSLLSSQHGNIILSLPSRAEKMTPWQMKKIWNLRKEERWGESIGLWDMQSLLCCLSCGHYRCMGPYMWRRVPGNKLTKGRTPTPAPSLHMDSVEIGFYCFNLQWRMAEPD